MPTATKKFLALCTFVKCPRRILLFVEDIARMRRALGNMTGQILL